MVSAEKGLSRLPSPAIHSACFRAAGILTKASSQVMPGSFKVDAVRRNAKTPSREGSAHGLSSSFMNGRTIEFPMRIPLARMKRSCGMAALCVASPVA